MSSWLAAAFGDWLGVSVMFDPSCPSRDDILKSIEGILGPISEQIKHTGIHFLCYEDTLICPGIRDDRHQSFSASTQPSQTRHARPKRTDFMGEKQTHINQSAPLPSRVWSQKLMEWTIDKYIITNQYPHNPSCVQESVVDKNERCYYVCL